MYISYEMMSIIYVYSDKVIDVYVNIDYKELR